MANVYQQQTQQPVFPLGAAPAQDLGGTSSGLSRAFGPFLKYSLPIVIVIVVCIVFAALIKTKSSGGGKDKDKDKDKK